MSVRERIKGNYQAWLVDYRDAGGHRRHKTFATQNEAERFHALVKSVDFGLPSELLNGYRPIDFTVALSGPLKSSRAAIANAASAVISVGYPTPERLIMHVIAKTPPRHVIADVDNFLKPVLDALTGIIWIDDTQVCELLVRRIVSPKSQLQIKIWRVPPEWLTSFFNIPKR